MTKILFINGETDSFTVSTIEKEIGLVNFIKEVESHGGKFEFEDEIRDIYGSAEIIEFGDIDVNFINLINNHFMDYDERKHRDFYVLE